MMSPEVVVSLLALLDQVSLSAADPELEAKAALLVKARAELNAALVPGPAPEAIVEPPPPSRQVKRAAARKKSAKSPSQRARSRPDGLPVEGESGATSDAVNQRVATNGAKP